MSRPFLKSLLSCAGTLALLIVLASLTAPRAPAQNAPAAALAKTTPRTKTWTQPRTPDGQPDLQGVWSNATTTPLERPATLAGKQVLTDEETTELEKETAQSRNSDRRDGKGTDADVGRAYNEFWWERGK